MRQGNNTGKTHLKICLYFIIVLLIGILIITSNAHADLKIDTAFPNQGIMGQGLTVTLKGTGFDGETRLFMTLDVGSKEAIIGTLDMSSAHGVAVVGDKAFVGDGWTGLFHVIDISNPRSPRIIGSVQTPGTVDGVFINGDIAYIADGLAGLQVIDISMPSYPQTIGAVDTPGNANSVIIGGDIAYVADGPGGLQVIDISDPENPRIVGSSATPAYANGVAVRGDKVLIACSGPDTESDSGLQVIDISSPENPLMTGFVVTPGFAEYVAINDDWAYVADGLKGLQIIDISTPSNPKIVNSLNISGYARHATVADNRIYVADAFNGLHVIDIDNPINPQIIKTVHTPGSAWAVTVSGDMAYIADDIGGLQVADISVTQSPQIIGNIDTPGNANGIAVMEDMAYVADGNRGLQIIDISNPANPHQLGGMDTDWALGVTLINKLAYVADGFGGLKVIDISTPENPWIVASVNMPGSVWGITVAGDMAYVADGNSGLQLIDISIPENPQIIGFIDTPGYAYKVAVQGSTAYVADGLSGLQVIDLHDIENPRIIGTANTPGSAESVAVKGSTAYVADGIAGLQLIDISNPENPQIIKSVDTPGYARDVALAGSTAYVVNDLHGLQIIDISTSNNPYTIGHLDTPGSAYDITVVGDEAFVAAQANGLVIVPLPVEVLPVMVNNEKTATVILPAPDMPGNYTLRALNAKDSREKTGMINFSTLDLENIQPDSLFIQTQDGEEVPGTIAPGDSYILQLVYKDPGGTLYNLSNIADQVRVEWYSNNPDILSINQNQGVTLAKAPGKARIMAKIPGNGISVSMQVNGKVQNQDKHYGNLIIISGRNSDMEEPASPINELANMIYLVFYNRGFEHEDIHYFSAYGGQQLPIEKVNIVDDEIGTTDKEAGKKIYEAITQWAVEQSNSGPLYIYLAGYGEYGQFNLNPYSNLSPSLLDEALFQFQQITNRQVVVIADTSYSGIWVDSLQCENRIILPNINRLTEDLSTFAPNSFSIPLLKELSSGKTLETAFNTAMRSMKGAGVLKKSKPEMYIGNDQLWKSCLAGSFVSSSDATILKAYTGKEVKLYVDPGSKIDLETTVEVLNEEWINAYALITPPFFEKQANKEGIEIPPVAPIKVDLFYHGGDGDEGYFGGGKIFSAQSPEFTEPGEYEVNFYVIDSLGEIYASDTVTFNVGTLTGGEEKLTLNPGWNLVGTRIGFTLKEFFFNNDIFTSLWKWENGNWAVALPGKDTLSYTRAKGFNELFGIDPGEGFWVHSLVSAIVSIRGIPGNGVLNVNPGWNLLSLKSNEKKAVKDLVSTVFFKITSVWKWEKNNWAVFLPNMDTVQYANSKGFHVIEYINPGEGFWMYCATK